MNIWGTFDDHRILRTLITFWGIEVALNTFCGPLRTSRALMTFWGIWGHFEDQLRTWGLSTLGTFCTFSWLFVDFVDLLRTFWRPEDLMLSEHWRTFLEHLMTSCGTFEDLRPLRNSRTFQDIEDLCEPEYLLRNWGGWYLLMNLRTFWGSNLRLRLLPLWTFEDFEDLWGPFETWGPEDLKFWGSVDELEDLRTVFGTFDLLWPFSFDLWRLQDFVDLLRTFWRPVDLRISKALKTFSGPFDDFLWTFWGLSFLELLRTLWGPFDEHLRNLDDAYRILRTLIQTFWGIEVAWIPFVDLWGLRGLWWPFEEFEDILRISWEPEVWGCWGPFCAFSWPFGDFVDLLRTFWRPEDLRISKHWRIFWTFWWLLVDHLRTVFRNFWGLCEDHLMNIWGTFDDYRILRTLITFWRIEVAWIPSMDLWGLRGLWWPFEEFEDILRISWEPEVWVPWVPFVHSLDILRTLWTFWGLFEDLRTWGSQSIEEFSGPFDDFLWTFWGLFLGKFEDFVRTTWWPFEELLTTYRILRTLVTFWGIEVALNTFVDLWGLRWLWWPLEEFEDILRISWEPEAWGPWVPFVHFLDFLRTLWTFWGLFEDLRTWGSQSIEEFSGPFDDFLWTFWGLFFGNFEDFVSDHLMNIWGTLTTYRILRTLINFWGIEVALNTFCGPLRTSRALMTFWGIWGHFEDQLRTWGLRTLGTFCAFSWLFEDFVDLLRTFWRPEDLRISKHWRIFWTFWWLLVDHLRTVFRNFWGLCEDHLMNIWGTFDDYRILRTLITFWGIEVAWIPFVDLWGLRGLWWPFEEFEDILRISWEPEVWVPWVPFVHFLDILWTLWTFWGLFEDLRTWGSQSIEEFSGPLMTSCGPFEDCF